MRYVVRRVLDHSRKRFPPGLYLQHTRARIERSKLSSFLVSSTDYRSGAKMRRIVSPMGSGDGRNRQFFRHGECRKAAAWLRAKVMSSITLPKSTATRGSKPAR